MTKNMDMEFMFGLMEKDMKDSGIMENKMVRVKLLWLMELLKKEFGKTDRD